MDGRCSDLRVGPGGLRQRRRSERAKGVEKAFVRGEGERGVDGVGRDCEVIERAFDGLDRTRGIAVDPAAGGEHGAARSAARRGTRVGRNSRVVGKSPFEYLCIWRVCGKRGARSRET